MTMHEATQIAYDTKRPFHQLTKIYTTFDRFESPLII